MTFAGINYLAVIVAAIASFGFGALYYMALAKPWMASLGKTEADLTRSKTPFVISAVAELVMAWMVAGALGHLGTAEQVTIRNGAITGVLLWFGFVLTTILVNHAYQGAKRSQTVIDVGHWLGVLVIQGLVIGAFGI